MKECDAANPCPSGARKCNESSIGGRKRKKKSEAFTKSASEGKKIMARKMMVHDSTI
jgi:hypothetical protein